MFLNSQAYKLHVKLLNKVQTTNCKLLKQTMYPFVQRFGHNDTITSLDNITILITVSSVVI